MKRFDKTIALGALLAGVACSSGSESTEQQEGYVSSVYSLDDNWLCNPTTTSNRCTQHGSATEIMPDNTTVPVAAPSDAGGELDCFYVYPTIDTTEEPGRVADYSNIELIWAMAKQQAEPFAELCDIYAPLYHQVQIGTYSDPEQRDPLLEEAYLEVEDAFQHYMAQHNGGRDIVLLGHSQGSHMLRRLLQRHFDGPANGDNRAQLAVAVLLGPLGDITVPAGAVVGGSFQDIPVCESSGQRGCVVTYSSYGADTPPDETFGLFVGGIPSGMQAPCTNPAALGGGKAMSSGAYLPSSGGGGMVTNYQAELGVETFFSVLRDYYALECRQSPAGQPFLAVSIEAQAGDQRTDPVQHDSPALAEALIGLHQLDYNLALEDLRGLVQAHAQ